MNGYVDVGSLKVAKNLHELINNETMTRSETDTQQFWIEFEKLINDLTPENDAILEKRKDLQEKMNQYHKENKSNDFHSYKQFLKEIGYLQPIPEDFRIETENVDDELKQAGTQLVDSVNNLIYDLNDDKTH